MTSQLMAYVPAAVVAGSAQGHIVPDLTNNRYYMGSTTTGTPGLNQFTGLVSGDCTLQRTATNLGLEFVVESPITITYNGNLIFPVGSGGNSCQLAQVRGTDLFLLSTAFKISSATANSSNASMLTPGSLVPLRYGRTDFVMATTAALNEGEVSVLTVPGLSLTNLGNTTETGRACLGPGAISNLVGTGYVMGRQTNQFSLYKVVVPALSLTKLATFTPTNIDATWTNFSFMCGVVYDQTDGNVIIGVQTTDAVTNKSYICKLNGNTGALIWKSAIVFNGADAENNMSVSVIKNGTYYCWGNFNSGSAGSPLYTINTATGSFTSAIISDMNVGQLGVSEDIWNSITSNAEWAQSATVPTYIGTYMGTEGNHSYTGWLRFFPNGPTPPLPPAPPTLVTGPPVVSVNRAWSYVLDGHTFYVLDLGAQGTFVFDKVTGQWSNFATGVLNTVEGPQPQWNFQNGCMWGTRIMGCDLAVPTIWETTPGSVLDNDASEITHLVTGGISARSRTYNSVDSLRVSGSFGFLESDGVVDFNLRFSDDQEYTWSPYYVVTLTPDNYGDEIAWRSLGSFAAPGRIFELSDAGGLVRIDGCDAFIDGFDNDQQNGSDK